MQRPGRQSVQRLASVHLFEPDSAGHAVRLPVVVARASCFILTPTSFSRSYLEDSGFCGAVPSRHQPEDGPLPPCAKA